MTKGVVRSIDNLGRIVIPKEYRKILDITSKDKLEVNINDDVIEIRKYNLEDNFLKIQNLYFKALNKVYPNKVFFCTFDNIYLFDKKRRLKNNELFVKLRHIKDVIFIEATLYLEEYRLEGYYLIPIRLIDKIIGFVIIGTDKEDIEKIKFISDLINN
ncbi:MAG: AbrB/MazE/SpoVT family DNA-binding domain-containing protein [Bacilli bacterium]